MPANLSDLAQQNPNISSQIDVWQRERMNNGQSPADWEAFRQHAIAIGAPDPGQEAPGEFMQSASSVQSSASSAQSSGASGSFGGQQSQQVQAPQQVQQAPQQWQQPAQQVQQPQQPQHSREVLDAIRIRNEYEADKNTPTDRWLKARGMTKAQLDAALALAASADPNRTA